MKKIILFSITIFASLFLVLFFLQKKEFSRRSEIIQKILIDINPREAFFNQPTLLNISSNCSDFIDIFIDCATLSVCYEVASDADYVCRESDGWVEIYFSDHRLILEKSKTTWSPRESFDFLINVVNAVPTDLSDVMKMPKNAFGELVSLLAAKAFMYHETEEIFHVKMDHLEMVLERSGKYENLWGAIVYYNDKYYSAVLFPNDESIQPNKVAKLIASFRIMDFKMEQQK